VKHDTSSQTKTNSTRGSKRGNSKDRDHKEETDAETAGRSKAAHARSQPPAAKNTARKKQQKKPVSGRSIKNNFLPILLTNPLFFHFR